VPELIDCGSGVFSGDTVDLDACLLAQLLVGRHRLADGRPLAHQLDKVADFQAQASHVRRVEPRQAATKILGKRLGDLQLQVTRVCHWPIPLLSGTNAGTGSRGFRCDMYGSSVRA